MPRSRMHRTIQLRDWTHVIRLLHERRRIRYCRKDYGRRSTIQKGQATSPGFKIACRTEEARRKSRDQAGTSTTMSTAILVHHHTRPPKGMNYHSIPASMQTRETQHTDAKRHGLQPVIFGVPWQMASRAEPGTRRTTHLAAVVSSIETLAPKPIPSGGLTYPDDRAF
jgi:hypothetical protein